MLCYNIFSLISFTLCFIQSFPCFVKDSLCFSNSFLTNSKNLSCLIEILFLVGDFTSNGYFLVLENTHIL